MKKIILFVVLLWSGYVNAQPKGTTIIKIKGASFNSVVTAILDSGYQIKDIDKDFLTMTTKPNMDFYRQVIYLRVKDSTATLHAEWSGGEIIFDTEQTFNNPEDNRGKTRPMAATWTRFFNIAKSLNLPMEYAKK